MIEKIQIIRSTVDKHGQSLHITSVEKGGLKIQFHDNCHIDGHLGENWIHISGNVAEILREALTEFLSAKSLVEELRIRK